MHFALKCKINASVWLGACLLLPPLSQFTDLELVAQSGCGCPIPGILQGQAGWGPEYDDLEEHVPACDEGDWNLMIFTAPSSLSHSVIW